RERRVALPRVRRSRAAARAARALRADGGAGEGSPRLNSRTPSAAQPPLARSGHPREDGGPLLRRPPWEESMRARLSVFVATNVGQSGTMALGFTNALYVGP